MSEKLGQTGMMPTALFNIFECAEQKQPFIANFVLLEASTILLIA